MRKIILLVVIIIAIGFFWSQSRDDSEIKIEQNDEVSEESENIQSEEETTNDSELVGFEAEEPISQGQNKVTHLVTYTDNGYVPSSLNIGIGDTVVFENQSKGQMWTATAMHPDHTGYDSSHTTSLCSEDAGGENVFDQCGTGDSFTFTFNKVGEWGYHNHVKAGDWGKIIVE